MADTFDHIYFLIPAYEPDRTLNELVCRLVYLGVPSNRIFVVNDGSSSSSSFVFEKLKADGISVEKHAVNLGKGQALKTGLNKIAVSDNQLCGVVTLDADGQHCPEDAIRIAEDLAQNPECLVLGARRFENEIPLRSKFGNLITQKAFHIVTGKRITDTQTGLRGIPGVLIPDLLVIRTMNYDFELEMLIKAIESKLELREVAIKTIYIDENASSHFQPLLDSFKIYFVFIRFLSISFISFLFEYILYATAFLLIAGLNPIVLHVICRLVSSFGNFILNKHFVFKSKAPMLTEYYNYFVTMVVILISTSAILYALVYFASIPPLLAKPLAEAVGFISSFYIQRAFVFNKKC